MRIIKAWWQQLAPCGQAERGRRSMQHHLEPPASRTSDVSLQAQVRCLEREIALRRSVYRRLTGDGRMKPQMAADEIATMTAVLATVRAARQVEIAKEAQDRYAAEERVRAAVEAERNESRDLAAYNDPAASGGDPEAGGDAPGS